MFNKDNEYGRADGRLVRPPERLRLGRRRAGPRAAPDEALAKPRGGDLQPRISAKALAFLIVAALAIGLWASHTALSAGLARWEARATVARYNTTPVFDGQLHVVWCGGVAPATDPYRAQNCVAIMGGGNFVLIDAGDGAALRAEKLGLPLGDLNAILFTDLDSSHIGDLGQIAEASWRDGRVGPLAAYGPEGTSQIVSGFDQAYALSVKFRAARANEVNLPGDNALPVGHDVGTPASAALVPVYHANGLVISAFSEPDPPARAAFGYRVLYHDHVVVISGDGRPGPELVRAAERADLLIAPAWFQPTMNRMIGGYEQAYGADAQPGGRDLARNLRALESAGGSVADVSAEAAQARVGALALTTLGAPVNDAWTGWMMRWWIRRAAGEVYSGPVSVARPGLRYAF